MFRLNRNPNNRTVVITKTENISELLTISKYNGVHWSMYPIRKNRTIQFSYAKLFQRQTPSKRLQNRPSPRQTRHNQNVPQLVMIAELVQDLISRNLADYKNSGLICYDRETIDKQLFEYLKRYYKVRIYLTNFTI
ncbi:unnamed protein product [Didymodactylos carnosus]|uniref:Uncharacterized protein n=1 Tax=Didymodactylos carnosus TaxID=1234261 RepID=A0A8S2F088_9BILA|nr:unnamed protein product [Didymodactylos carnosus]CAF4127054.1 unnamed protein product [Didymodactylos carnosus]